MSSSRLEGDGAMRADYSATSATPFRKITSYEQRQGNRKRHDNAAFPFHSISLAYRMARRQGITIAPSQKCRVLLSRLLCETLAAR